MIFYVTVANPFGPTALAPAGPRKGFTHEEAVKDKDAKYGGTYRPTDKLVPLDFSMCGDYASRVQDLVQEPGKVK